MNRRIQLREIVSVFVFGILLHVSSSIEYGSSYVKSMLQVLYNSYLHGHVWPVACV